MNLTYFVPELVSNFYTSNIKSISGTELDMPLNRSPPQRSDSVPNLEELERDNKTGRSAATGRFKRKHEDTKFEELKASIDEIKNMITNTNTKQDERYKCLQSDAREIKEHNADLRRSLEFISKKYDEIKVKLDSMETEKRNNFLIIKKLEDKIELLERNSKAASLEVRNVSQSKPETKDDLVAIVTSVGKAINMPIAPSEIKDVFRTKSKQAHQPIVVEFTTTVMKEKMLTSLKSLKKDQRGNQLTSTMIGIGGPTVPLYVSDNLTAKARRLFSLARAFAKVNEYKYCWTSHGQVYLRKNDGASALRIREEDDLDNLKTDSK